MALDLIHRRLLIGMSNEEVRSLLGEWSPTDRGFAVYPIGSCPTLGWFNGELRFVFDGKTATVVSATFHQRERVTYGGVALAFFVFGVILLLIATPFRRRYPGAYFVATGVMSFATGLWALISTIDDFLADRARVISWRIGGYYMRSIDPDHFWASVWFHGIGGILLIGVGILAILMLVKTGFLPNGISRGEDAG